MKFIVNFLKASFKFFALIVVGAFVLMFVNEQIFPSASNAIFGFIFIAYAIFALLIAVKPGIFFQEN